MTTMTDELVHSVNVGGESEEQVLGTRVSSKAQFCKIYLSSAKCSMTTHRQVVMSVISKNHYCITRDYESTSPQVEDLIEKIKQSSAVIVLVGIHYGEKADALCSGCILQDTCKYKKKDGECQISYPHYEYLLAKHYRKPIFVKISDDVKLEDEKKKICYIRNLERCKALHHALGNCGDKSYCQKDEFEDINPKSFQEWIEELRDIENNQRLRRKELHMWVDNFSNIQSLKKGLPEFLNGLPKQFEFEEEAVFDPVTLQILRKVGVDRCIAQLKDTEFAPKRCMEQIRKKLWFAGVSGSKWVRDAERLDKMRKMLNRLKTNGGIVRFLLIDPTCDAFQTLRETRENALSVEPYSTWMKLVEAFGDCLEVRCYSRLPSFRLQFMDDRLCAVARYQMDRENYEKENQGWNTPHLIIKSTGDNSFYIVYEQYFFHEWSKARKLEDVIKEMNQQEGGTQQ